MHCFNSRFTRQELDAVPPAALIEAMQNRKGENKNNDDEEGGKEQKRDERCYRGKI